MADYRLSAQVITRAKGQSAVASAAYRAAARLDDPRTGEVHDYTRKGGVVHSEILAPDNAPEWMRDRAALWPAVEAAEKRRDAQLAREVQLSLPHELTDEQRRELVRSFAKEQFVSRGMVADLSIHRPDREGDQRNHHAHILLTMRSLTGDGFGNKVRDWNDAATLGQWREAWAHHQNRELERHGHNARVDHRSLKEQGVDREPGQHLGPNASEMERRGRPSRIADENRNTEDRNAVRARAHGAAVIVNFEVERERRRFDEWARVKRKEVEHAQQLGQLDLTRKQERQRAALDYEMRDRYGRHMLTTAKEIEAADRRLSSTGFRKVMRDLMGRTRADAQNREDLTRTLRGIESRITEQRRTLEIEQQAERDKLVAEQDRRREAMERGIEQRRQEREAAEWQRRKKEREKEAERPRPAGPAAPTPAQKAQPYFVPVPGPRMKPAGMPEPAARKPAPTAPQDAQERAFRENAADMTRPADKPPQAAPEAKPALSWWEKERTDKTPSLNQPWQSSAFNRSRPWESGRAPDRPGRERSPEDDEGPKPKKN